VCEPTQQATAAAEMNLLLVLLMVVADIKKKKNHHLSRVHLPIYLVIASKYTYHHVIYRRIHANRMEAPCQDRVPVCGDGREQVRCD
jgi:hypothetical protein